MVCVYIHSGKDPCVKKKTGCKLSPKKKSHLFKYHFIDKKFDFYFKSKFCPMHHDTYWIL